MAFSGLYVHMVLDNTTQYHTELQNFDIKTPEEHQFLDDYYGPAERVPTYMRPYRRYKGLETHQYKDLVKLNGRSYANRIRNYLQGDPRYKFEILTNRKIDTILRRIKGSNFTNLIVHYERYQHPKFLEFLESLPLQYMKTASIAQYLFVIFLSIMEEVQGKRPSLSQFKELLEVMEIESRPPLKIKMALVDAGVIQKRPLVERRKMETMTTIEEAAQYIYNLEFIAPERKHQVVTSLGQITERYGLIKKGSKYRAELLVILGFLETREDDITVTLKSYIRRFFTDQETVEGTYGKLYRLRACSEELVELLNKFSFGRASTEERQEQVIKRINIEAGVQKSKLRRYIEINQSTMSEVEEVEVLHQTCGKEEAEMQEEREVTERMGREKPCVQEEIYSPLEIDFTKNLIHYSEPKKVSRVVIYYAKRYIERRNAFLLDEGDNRQRLEEKLSSDERRTLEKRWRKREEICQEDFVIILNTEQDIPKTSGHMAMRGVDLKFNTLNYETYNRFEEVLPDITLHTPEQETVIEQPAIYLKEYFQSLSGAEVHEVSTVINNGKQLWVAWTEKEPIITSNKERRKILHYPLETGLIPTNVIRSTLVAGNRGVRHFALLKALLFRAHQMKLQLDDLPPLLWFGTRNSLFRSFIAIGAKTKNILRLVSEYRITVIDKPQFNEITDLALFLKFQMPRLPPDSIIVVTGITEMISRLYINETIYNKTVEDFYQDLMWKNYPKFEQEFNEEYGQDFIQLQLSSWERKLDYVPTRAERAIELNRVKKKIEDNWLEEFETFKLRIMQKASELYQWVKSGRVHAFESDYSVEAKETIVECLRAIKHIARRDGIHIILMVELFGHFKPEPTEKSYQILPGVKEFIKKSGKTYEERTEVLIQRLIHSSALDTWHVVYALMENEAITYFSRAGGKIWQAEKTNYRDSRGVFL